MSDRRPENPNLYEDTHGDGCGCPADQVTRPAWAYDEDGYCVCCGNGRWKHHMPECELADALDALRDPAAAVRRGVESGEIEGLPLFCAAHWCALTPDESTCSLYQRVEGMDTCSIEYRILLIPTTDSERHP